MQWNDWKSECDDKRTYWKSIGVEQKNDWVKHLDNLIENINNSQHRITGFAPNTIQTAFKNDDNENLDSARGKEL